MSPATDRPAVDRIIYACYGGTHSSPVAAAIHLRQLPRDRLPTPEELKSLPLFDRLTEADRGRAHFAGTDGRGREVFVLGRGNEPAAIEAALRSGWRMAGQDESRLYFVNTLVCVNLAMRIGGFLSRAVRWPTLGRPLVIWGTRRAYFDLCRLVERVERELDGTGEPAERARGSCGGLLPS